MALIVALSGCRPAVTLLEQEDLVSILHNKETDYTLLVYLRPDGFERRVVRQGGQFVLMLERRGWEEYVLVEPGARPRRLEGRELMVQMERIDTLVFGDAETLQEGNQKAPGESRKTGRWRSA